MNIFKALFFLLGSFLVLETVFFINSWLYGQLKPFCGFDKQRVVYQPTASSDGPNAELEVAVKLAVEEVVSKAVQDGLEKAVSKAVVEGIADVQPQAVPGGSSNAEMKVMECEKLKEELAACDAAGETVEVEELPEAELAPGEEGSAVVEERTEEENAELIEQAEEDFAATREEEAAKEAESLAEAEQLLAEAEEASKAEAAEGAEAAAPAEEGAAGDDSVVSVEAMNAGADETVTLIEGEEGKTPKEGEPVEGQAVAAAA